MMLVDSRIKQVKEPCGNKRERYTQKKKWAVTRQFESGTKSMIIVNEYDSWFDAIRVHEKNREEIERRESNLAIVDGLINELIDALMKGDDTTEIYMELDYYGIDRNEVMRRLKR